MQGFTIIEVLVAVALFAVVVLVVLAPLTGLFGLTQKSNRQTGATNVAQQALETFKGQWQNISRNQYDLNCVIGPLYTTSLNPTPTLTYTVQDENVLGTSVANTKIFFVGTSTTCPGTAASGVTVTPGPAIRRVSVTATVGAVSSTLVLEVAR